MANLTKDNAINQKTMNDILIQFRVAFITAQLNCYPTLVLKVIHQSDKKTPDLISHDSPNCDIDSSITNSAQGPVALNLHLYEIFALDDPLFQYSMRI